MPQCTHAIVSKVRITAVTAQDISFSTCSSSGNSREFTCKRAEILDNAQLPAGAPPAVPLTVGEVGNLYLSRVGWSTTATGAPSEHIYGYKIPGAVVFKWPQCGAPAQRFVSSLDIIPSQISLTATITSGPSKGVRTIDIYNECSAPQVIEWDRAGDVRLQLVRPNGEVETIDVWPTSLVVAGAAASAIAISGRVDVLDAEKASTLLHFVFNGKNKSISIELTQDGLAEFHVVPESLRRIARGEQVNDAEKASETMDFHCAQE
jgi:hypothetical protein